MSRLVSIAFAAIKSVGESALGRPPILPRALAASRPALDRSRIIERSNSANAPKMWKISRPPAVVVSICSVSELAV
jgi:hypothetical protein